MPADSNTNVLVIGAIRVPYSLISLVTLTVQNSALTILLHYSRTAPNAKPYSAAAAVLLNEILKGSISFAIALNNVEPPPPGSLAHSRYSADGGAPPLISNGKKSQSTRKRQESLNLGSEETWYKAHHGLNASAAPRMRTWWLMPSQWMYRASAVTKAVLSPDCWKLAVPACCYVLQNNLQFVAASNLDVATFQVTYQMKILTTALFSVTMLHKRLSLQKWACLIALATGVAIVQLAGSSTSAKDPGHAAMDPFVGFVAVTMACMTSGFAGVYFEKVLKGSTADLWVRNIQLTLFSLLPAFMAAMFPDFSIRDFFSSDTAPTYKPPAADAPTWLFGNFGGWALATVFCQVFGGLVTALVIKYSDNIAKGFATSLSIVISFLAGVILFNFSVTAGFVGGCSIVLAATYYYNRPEGDSGAKARPTSAAYLPLQQGADARTFSVEVSQFESSPSTSGPQRRHMSVDHTNGDPPYPYSDYSSKGSTPPQFINLQPFAAPKVAPPLEHDLSPRSPAPPSLPEGQPIGDSALREKTSI